MGYFDARDIASRRAAMWQLVSYTLFGFVARMDCLTAAAASIATCGGLVLGRDQLSTLLDVSAKDGGGSRLCGAQNLLYLSCSCHQFRE